MRRRALLAAGGLALAAAPARAQLNLLLSPKTLFDRAIEARSTIDIAKDNAIVLKVNAVMAEAGTAKTSTEIYEQRLLMTGLLEDKPTYDKLYAGVRNVSGIRRLYWHVIDMSDADQQKNHLLSWENTLIIEEKAKARITTTADVADVNYRIVADPRGVIYLLGLARSEPEHQKALAVMREGDGVTKVVDYVVVRPKD